MQPSEVFPVISPFRGIPAFAQASRNLDATLEKLPKNPTMSQKVVSILYDISRLVVIEFTFNRTRRKGLQQQDTPSRLSATQ